MSHTFAGDLFDMEDLDYGGEVGTVTTDFKQTNCKVHKLIRLK